MATRAHARVLPDARVGAIVPGMHWLPALMLSWLLTSACSGDGGPTMLCDLPAFRGEVRIDARIGGEGRVLEGELTFDRSRDTVVLRRTVAGSVVELRRDGASGVRKSVDGEAVELELADIGDFTLLSSVLSGRPEAGAEIRATADGYTVETGDRRIAVRLAPAKSTGR